jgi:hypothetical protein
MYWILEITDECGEKALAKGNCQDENKDYKTNNERFFAPSGLTIDGRSVSVGWIAKSDFAGAIDGHGAPRFC